jgi:hypothetical protein
MTPKEKAKELVNKMYGDELDYMTEGQAKQCALIAVDEILTVSKFFKLIAETEYWLEVKQEIEKL